ncbi:MAG: hypothetical protein PF961_23935 [Planctomycetota bacterium]|nr:hypothetical protein [Planctomycetota bacterium]
MTLTVATHQAAAEAAASEARRRRRSYNLIALLRFVAFIALAIGAAATIADATVWSIALAGGSLAAFLLLALWHLQVDDHLRRARLLERYHRRGSERLQGQWDHGQDDGTTWVSAKHAFAADLDVVGPGGLFQLLNTAGSRPGRSQLAAWLLDNVARVDAQRQGQVQQLAEAHAWRASLAVMATGDVDEHGDGVDEIETWLAKRPAQPAAWWWVVVWIGRILGPGLLVYGAWRDGGGGMLLALLLVSVLWFPIDGIARRSLALKEPSRSRVRVRAYARALSAIAEAPGAHPELARLRSEAATAAAGLEGLAKALDAVAKGGNALRALLGAVVLIEWRNMRRLHRWADQYGRDYPAWCACLGRGEALSCLATYAAEQGGCWANEAEAGHLLVTDDLAHPLLPRDSRVGNAIDLRDGQVLLLTGANASGKSTFMRAIALAVVLTRLGAPVPAKSCAMRAMRLATVMRVSDDLRSGRSRFQAEVERLKVVLDLAHAGDAPLLLGLDEILAGTNSRERHLGTKAVIDHLRGTAGCLVVSTHDLDLARLSEHEPERFVLAHFADRAALEHSEGPDMAFDYALRPGVLETTNALRVMKAFGLPVDEV